MADVITSVYQFILPEVGASDDTWGIKLNDDLQKLETLFNSRWGGGGPSSLGTYWNSPLQAIHANGAKSIALNTAAGVQEGAFGIDAVGGNVFLQKLNAAGTALARLRLETNGAINAHVGFFKGSGAGLTNIPATALPDTLVVDSVTANAVTARLTHTHGYLVIDSYDDAVYGSGAGRLWWNQNDRQLNLTAADMNPADLRVTGGMQINDGKLFVRGTYPAVKFDDYDSGTVITMTGGSGFFRFGESDSAGLIVEDWFTISENNITAQGSRQFVGSGAGLTNLPASSLTGIVSASRLPTDAAAELWVGDRIAGMAAQQLGTYCLLLGPSGSNLSNGDLLAGSSLRFPYLRVDAVSTDLEMGYSASGPSGSWRAMQNVIVSSGERPFATFLRYV